MEWLNYHHLHYFWVVAKEGSITAACRRLRLAQPTVSAQLRTLEDRLGVSLFSRTGRRLQLTETGRMVYRRADEIFSLGRDLMNTLKRRPSGAPILRLNVGVADALPKLMVYRLLEPATHMPQPAGLICQGGSHTDLLAKLATYELDLVLTDAPIGPLVRVRAFNHLLGECGVSVFAGREMAATYRRGFPDCLHEAPFLLPGPNTSLRHSMDRWFEAKGIEPKIMGEIEDCALLKVFGQTGLGLFVMPTVEEEEVQRQYDVRLVGRLEDVRERFYAISTERRVTNPAIRAITEAAHKEIFE